MYLLGPHIDPPLAEIPSLLNEYPARVFQTTLRNPGRLSKEGLPGPEDCAAYREQATGKGLFGIVHASLLTSLGSPDPRIRHGSVNALVGDANLAAELGLQGVCFHVGYGKGHETREAALEAVAFRLKELAPKLKPGARILLENGCEGTELGVDAAEIGSVVAQCGLGTDQLGVVIDTCHLHVAGFDLSAPDAPVSLWNELVDAGLASYLTALHLNDAREACGSKRDRHAPPGQGTIGEGLKRLLAYPAFSGLPAILEVSSQGVREGIAYLTAS